MITDEKQYRLTKEEKAFYEENGYILAKGVFTREEADFFCREAHDLTRRLAEASDTWSRIEGWGSAAKVTSKPRELLHCHNVQFHSAAFSRLIVDPRFTDRAADIIGRTSS
ncbi:MAG: hypothetical protein FJY97_21090, partial [candidate division Zixibacteria bacterium]|nr:hypothetical protein [candidate division Zixibacteria bacterium]